MTWIAGADGCKAGWFRAARETASGALRFAIVGTAAELLSEAPRPALLAIDIPIGLTDAGPRACDARARDCLGWPRRNSVFPAPIRPALGAGSREEASRLTEPCDGRRVGAQAFALYPKIRQADALARRGDAGARIYEVHPEVCFWAWNGKQPMVASKKSREGRKQRLALVEGWLGPSALAHARGELLKRQAADDDILDAVAALWTAARIFEGRAQTLPEAPPTDARGLPMRIVY